ncbi:MAG: hypothetical protein Q8L48_00405 [Archangium sp.]|nr:hypothetical protein [Archangium sp.]
MRVLPALCVLLVACPERQAPERGLMLTYKKPTSDPLRSVVDRRLAQLKLRANLHEDGSTLTVRVAEGTDVSRIKALFAQTAHLEFCGEDGAVAGQWCEASWPSGITTDSAMRACALLGPTRKALEAALGADAGLAAADGGADAGPGDAGARTFAPAPRSIAFGTSGTQATAFAVTGCFSPRVVAADVRDGKDQPGALSLEFDRAAGRDFAALTTSLVGKRLIILLDGEVQSAPVVREPITGGKAMLTTGLHDREAMEVLAASLVGGTLPVLVLEREGTWGPPSLKR